MTRIMLSDRIFKSYNVFRFARYSASNSTFLSSDISSRPLICAQPVIPGTKWCMPLCVRSSMRSYWLKSAGRGPTKLMSPQITHQIWGSSSRLVRRRRDPKGVTHLWGFSRRWVATAGVRVSIVLNLGIKNLLLSRPTLSLQCRAGPGELSRTQSHKKNIGRRRRDRRITPSERSTNRFIFEISLMLVLYPQGSTLVGAIRVTLVSYQCQLGAIDPTFGKGPHD